MIKADKLIHIPLGEVQEALQLDSEDFLAQYNAEKPKVDDEVSNILEVMILNPVFSWYSTVWLV